MTRYLLSLTLSVSIAIVILALFSLPSQADIPQMISYQGKVNDSGGTPVADGAYTMRFRIYDDAGAGNLEWDSGDQSVQVTGGVFNVMLGESPQPVIDLEFDEDYWLLVTIETDDQLPRVRVASAGYAYMASGLAPGTEVSGLVNSGTYAAVKGVNTSTTGATCGGRFESYSTSGRAVYGQASATTGSAYGVCGESAATSGRGVYGYVSATSGTNYGVYGKTDSPSGYAGYFDGDAKVTGDLTVDGALTAPGMGDISAVNAGTGMDGGGTSGDVTLNVEVPLSLAGSSSGIGIIEGYNASTSGRGVYGEASATTGYTYGGRFESASTSGRAVYGSASAGTGTTYGVYGQSNSAAGYGVYGKAAGGTGTTYGVYGQSHSAAGYGVYGLAEATTGINYGVAGESHSTSGRGVYGYATATSGANYGMSGRSASTSGRGVYGYATATSGTNYGVSGRSASTSGRGVYGYVSATSGTNYGVYGQSASTDGRGVYGYASSGSGTTFGVHGESNSTNGRAVYGHAIATTGECFGGRFENGSTSGRGVFGHAYSGTGTTYGVYGQSNSAAGYGVYYSGGLTGSGSKNCVVKTSQGPTLMYCQESPESWFEDFGEGRLVDGRCHVELDPLFLETVTINQQNPLKVFVQLENEESTGLKVRRGLTGFEVENGTSDSIFWYRVVAKRKGFEQRRLDYCKAAETDSYLYPELRKKELREREEERGRLHRESPSNQAE